MTPSDAGDDSRNAESSGIPLEERRVVTSGRGGTPQTDSVMPSTSQNPSHGYQNPSQTHASRSTPASSSTASDSTTPGVGVLASSAGSAHRYSSPAPIISYTAGPGPGGGANHHNASGNPNMTTKRSLPTNITFATGLPATLSDRFVQQHHPSSHGHHQNRSKQTHGQNKPGGDSKVSHKKLKKYASETSFASAVDLPSTVMCSHSDETPSPPIAFSPSAGVLQPLLGHEKLQDMERGDREVRTGSNRVFHVRTVPNSNSVVNYFNPTPKSSGATQVTQVTNGSGGSGGNAVINKLQRRSQCRADSDDGNGSGSVGSETTVASGTMTPQSRRNMRFKMRRPKSTGNMMPGTTTNHVSSGAGNHGIPGIPLAQGHLNQLQSNNNNNSNSGNYDPSFTSATIHSLDDSIHKDVQEVVMEERRPSNFYLFEDDSNHEFDDEVTGSFWICE